MMTEEERAAAAAISGYRAESMPEYEVKIKTRIEELKAQRDKFLAEANQQLAALNGAIAELERLIAPGGE